MNNIMYILYIYEQLWINNLSKRNKNEDIFLILDFIKLYYSEWLYINYYAYIWEFHVGCIIIFISE